MTTTKRNHRLPWTLQEMEYVEKHYSKMSCAAIGEHLGRSVNAVRAIAKKLGCAPQKSPDWSDREIDIIRETYGTDLEVDEICAMLTGRSAVSVAIKARKLGLTRPEPFW